MPKSHKDISLFTDLPPAASEPQRFAPDQLVRCEQCLRANPPTRTACLYCGAALTESAANPAKPKPSLRPLEKWEQGFNSILITSPVAEIAQDSLEQAASLLRLKVEDLTRIIQSQTALPLARSALREEAIMIQESLSPLGLETIVVSDESLALEKIPPHRLRTVEFFEARIVVHPTSADAKEIQWNEIILIVAGRLFAKQVEVKERKRRGAEKEIIDARETTSDEAVLDIYIHVQDGGWRILANNFDFSCLGHAKTLLAGQNFALLRKSICERATRAEYNDSYSAIRRNLELVWPSEQQTSSTGWRRERAGKYTTGEVAMTSNESQFTRYSRLCHLLKVGASTPA